MVKNKITIKDIYHFMKILKVCFRKIDPIGIAKHKLYKLC